MRQWPFILGVIFIATVLGAGARPLAPAVAQEDPSPPATRDVALVEGWNLVGWTGPPLSVAAITAQLQGVFESLHRFAAGPQGFEVVTASGPDFLNSLVAVAAGDGLWIFSQGETVWQQPVITAARRVALQPGFNLVTWTGATGTPIAVALAGLGDALQVAFTYEERDELFLSYGPDRPPFLNSADFLTYGEGLWVQVDEPRTWEQPAPPPGSAVTSADGTTTVTVPVGLDATIAIAAMDEADLPEPSTAGGVLVGYRLTLTPAARGAAALAVQQSSGESLLIPPGETGFTYTPPPLTLPSTPPDVSTDGNLVQFCVCPFFSADTLNGDGTRTPLPNLEITIQPDGSVVFHGDTADDTWIWNPETQSWTQPIVIEFEGFPAVLQPVLEGEVTPLDPPGEGTKVSLSVPAGAEWARITVRPSAGAPPTQQVMAFDPMPDAPLTLEIPCDPSLDAQGLLGFAYHPPDGTTREARVFFTPCAADLVPPADSPFSPSPLFAPLTGQWPAVGAFSDFTNGDCGGFFDFTDPSYQFAISSDPVPGAPPGTVVGDILQGTTGQGVIIQFNLSNGEWFGASNRESPDDIPLEAYTNGQTQRNPDGTVTATADYTHLTQFPDTCTGRVRFDISPGVPIPFPNSPTPVTGG